MYIYIYIYIHICIYTYSLQKALLFRLPENKFVFQNKAVFFSKAFGYGKLRVDIWKTRFFDFNPKKS